MVREFSTIEEILDFAIASEVEAHDFYAALAQWTKNHEMHEVFEQFAIEELGHKVKLEAVKAGELLIGEEEKPPSLGIAEYLVDIEPKADMSYAEALILAMKREKAAYRLYLDLAEAAMAKELTDMFLALAGEEANHKLRFELEYDAQMGEN